MDTEDDDTDLRCATGKTRLYVEVDLSEGAEIGLDKDRSHYLRHVLRMGVGGHVALFNGRDGQGAAEIAEALKKDCGLIVLRQTGETEPLPAISLLFAPVKNARVDCMVQKDRESGGEGRSG